MTAPAIPTWKEADSKKTSGKTLTALEEFVWEYEPDTPHDTKFRSRLQQVLDMHLSQTLMVPVSLNEMVGNVLKKGARAGVDLLADMGDISAVIIKHGVLVELLVEALDLMESCSTKKSVREERLMEKICTFLGVENDS